MIVTTYGTAGSLAICRKDRETHGGNTSSLRIRSECLPAGTVLAVDAGTGFYPLCKRVLSEGGCERLAILFTHYHLDHVSGLPLVPQTYMKEVTMELMGPVDHGFGPKEAFDALMRPPFHPVDFSEQKSHFRFSKFEHPAGIVLLFHPKGGKKRLELHEFESMEASSEDVPMPNGEFPVKECLVVRMYLTSHSERTVSYRFEERPTGKTFVFLTDHENTDGISKALRSHVTGADLLIADAQYDEKTYQGHTAGFGHGTGKYVARLARECNVRKVGITHHDPGSSDEKIGRILAEAQAESPNQEIFACKDLESIEI